MKLIYLDYAATTPLDHAVLRVMHETEQHYYANPSSIHSAGQQSKIILEDARQAVAGSIHAKSNEITFTSGGTESNNLAIIGTAKANRHRGRHIITSKIEHPAVLESIKYLVDNGFHVSFVDVNMDGFLDRKQLKSLINEKTILVSLMLVNNESGCILPIKKIGEMLKDMPAVFHCDAVQGYDKLSFSVDDLGVDLLTLSAHKIYGPKGCGALYIREGTNIENITYGGGQEARRRPGTENLVAIAGFSEAIRQVSVQKDQIESMRSLRNLFEEKLKQTVPDIIINGEKADRIVNISNIYFPFMSADSLLINLDLQGIAVSTGSACSSGSPQPSHVLHAMGFSENHIKNSIRFSLGRYTTKQDILKTVETIRAISDRASKNGIRYKEKK
jgi:cysteine desulfurase